MRDQQLDEELIALDQSLERLCKQLDFRLLRLEELIPKQLQNRLAEGIAPAAAVLRLVLFGAACRRSPRWRGARIGIDTSALFALPAGRPRLLDSFPPQACPPPSALADR
jgi:hypothetical protein